MKLYIVKFGLFLIFTITDILGLSNSRLDLKTLNLFINRIHYIILTHPYIQRTFTSILSAKKMPNNYTFESREKYILHVRFTPHNILEIAEALWLLIIEIQGGKLFRWQPEGLGPRREEYVITIIHRTPTGGAGVLLHKTINKYSNGFNIECKLADDLKNFENHIEHLTLEFEIPAKPAIVGKQILAELLAPVGTRMYSTSAGDTPPHFFSAVHPNDFWKIPLPTNPQSSILDLVAADPQKLSGVLVTIPDKLFVEIYPYVQALSEAFGPFKLSFHAYCITPEGVTTEDDNWPGYEEFVLLNRMTVDGAGSIQNDLDFIEACQENFVLFGHGMHDDVDFAVREAYFCDEEVIFRITLEDDFDMPAPGGAYRLRLDQLFPINWYLPLESSYGYVDFDEDDLDEEVKRYEERKKRH